ncbi:adenosylmethionine--8-amino-7-oxononanoate transaminase [Paenibacillus sp. SC116]|uniref:adenosylmethionine--8-amino-7-oxononanoate transaminase n=1 Tax=Paenibacillus sp. SC116 TaxID=2968986 RepID=UPI00215AB4A1|nr:adenosylmethionine--8-amino-7-oxononanoate transaminase [Paenibacillus sp. SC116]MCR8845220.1 adenosylmethionine--8-amino-7-oxononanoate transaminase [Paenibacillus sp. SC116]
MDSKLKQELLSKDKQYVWHPFTQMKDYEHRDHLLIERAEGIFLIDADGRRYYDTVSSWWCNVHGHGHPRIKAAIQRQLDAFDHIMFSGLTHAPGIELAEKLVEITPEGLDKVFYSDNGSTAVEVALKMSFQYWQQIGKTSKTKFVYLDGSYHGDTLGAVSVGGVELYHALFKPLLFHAHRVPAADLRQARGAGVMDESEAAAARLESEREVAESALAAVRELFEREGDTIAGIVVEPMLMGAGGMIMTPAAYMQGLRELCTQHNVHLIADEVATGFGRTGKMFACEHAGVSPDIMCLSKGLTAGVMPLAVTLCTDEIYAAFYDDYHTQKTFFHGHSFTGNPVACAVAIESLRLFEEEQVLERAQASAVALAAALRDSGLTELPHVADVRQLGLVAAFDLYADAERREPFHPEQRIGAAIYQAGFEEGLILRPLGDTLYFWLPLCVTPEEVRDIVARTVRVLRRVLS